MGFFKDRFDQSNNTSSKLCRDLATKIKRAIQNHNKRPSGGMLVWVRTLARLREEKTEDTLVRVIDWYSKHIGEEFVPRALSPRVFYDRFDSLHKAMLTSDDPSELILPENLKLAHNLDRDYVFPIEVRSALPLLVQRSRDNWIAFLKELDEFKCDSERDSRFITNVFFAHAPYFIHRWFGMIAVKYGSMEHFTGPVMSLAFRANSKLFKDSFWRDWSMAWSGSPWTFDNLLDRFLLQENISHGNPPAEPR